jgi:hypothetical protein
MASSYASLFGTNGAAKRAVPTPDDDPTKPKTQTFSQMQQAGQARPAPPPPAAGQYQRYQGSGQAQAARAPMLQSIQQQLASPTRFDTAAFNQIRQAQQQNLNAEFGAQRSQLEEEMARRGLSASSIGAGRYGDLAGQQARAQATMDAELLQQAAQTQSQDRLASLQAAGQFVDLAGSQDLAEFEANRVGQAQGFQERLAAAQFGQGQSEFNREQAMQAANLQQTGGLAGMDLALRQQLGLGGLNLDAARLGQAGEQFGQSLAEQQAARQQQFGLSERELGLRQTLGIGELTGQVGGTQTLAASQQAEQQRQFNLQQQLQQTLGLGGLDVQRGQLGLEKQRLQQQASDTAAERQLREALQTRELTAQEKQQLAEIDARKDLQTNELAEQQADRRLREQLSMVELTGQGTVTGEDGTTRTVSTLAAQRLGQEGTALALEQAQQLSQQTGNVYTLDNNGVVTPMLVGGKPVRTESALARVSQDEMRRAEMTGKIQIDGVSVDTLAARELNQQQLDALRDQALRQSQVTGTMYQVNAQGQVVPSEPRILTEQSRAQQAQEVQQSRALASQQAEALSQQTGLAYKINDSGKVVPDTDSSGQQRTTIAARQLAQQRDLQLAELRGTVEVQGPNGTMISVPTVAAQQMQQGAFRNALAQAESQSQSTGLAYTVDAQGRVVVQNDAAGNPITTVAARQLAQQRELALAELTGSTQMPGPDGRMISVSTIAARQLGQQQARDLAAQAAVRSELTGFMYKVNDDGQIVQEFDGDKPISTQQETQFAANLGLDQQRMGLDQQRFQLQLAAALAPMTAAQRNQFFANFNKPKEEPKDVPIGQTTGDGGGPPGTNLDLDFGDLQRQIAELFKANPITYG